MTRQTVLISFDRRGYSAFVPEPASPFWLHWPPTVRYTDRQSDAGILRWPRHGWRIILLAIALASSLLPGCSGKSAKVDNPVFAPAPPRRALVNRAADEEERRLAGIASLPETDAAPFRSTGFQQLSQGPLTGNSVVAIVNGQSVFLDDVLGGLRQKLEQNPQLSTDQCQAIMLNELRKRLPRYTEDQLIIQAVERKIPADRREEVRKSLEPKFQEVLDSILKKEQKATVQELDEWLVSEGTSVDELRENFFRIQMVEGYITSLAKVPEKIDREELLQYYNEHLADYTSEEQIRFSKIVLRFEKHGGQSQAEQVLAQVMTQLNQSRDFGDVAAEFSDASNREKRGDMGWVKRGALQPELEELLFALASGTTSSVRTLNDRYELFHVVDRKESSTVPFADVQKEIEERLLEEKRVESRQAVRDQIRSKGNIVTMVEPLVRTTSAGTSSDQP